jgi:hypothetical protein
MSEFLATIEQHPMAFAGVLIATRLVLGVIGDVIRKAKR